MLGCVTLGLVAFEVNRSVPNLLQTEVRSYCRFRRRSPTIVPSERQMRPRVPVNAGEVESWMGVEILFPDRATRRAQVLKEG